MAPESGSTWQLAAIQTVNILAVILATWSIPAALGFSIVSDPLLTIQLLLVSILPKQPIKVYTKHKKSTQTPTVTAVVIRL